MPDNPRATLRDIAAETGVSVATVSRVLNDHVNVAPRTRDLVLQAVERRKLPADPVGRRTVYVRCPYVLTDYFGLIVSSIAETLKLHGLRLLLDAGESAQHSDALPGLPGEDDVSAAILILPPEDGEALVALSRTGFPFVVVDPRTPPPPDIAAVSAAHFSGARAVADHLVGHGHRDIGVIAGPQEWLASDARLAGHRAALAQAGVLLTPERLRHIEPTTAAGRAAAADLLDRTPRPTAIVCFNDKVAVGTLQAARERGLRVPEDLSIAGFDDIDLSQATDPPLTTVRQPLQEMGRIAVTHLMRVLDGHQPEALHIELATTLVVRDSTAAPGRAGAQAR
ncbi:LacI family DNA-binding transcriptional regulator [Actinophytocola algeriensis]|uniref:LacI family transcriptional regulator n=1 Tax=Actinophytocola algeriensis TaxID=1768010 RepID=A0A7W7Q800_9PSEU|nr:LacI family DNA-binding transcriptional regulator [Actinophytocola algeriensis]MBB4908538.1 LacI family transcriptional regulator [Actinophytocola algeriensis]MBE1475075.1 LacI family transcriptional regulator [Actinophytocola algeriensis]